MKKIDTSMLFDDEGIDVSSSETEPSPEYSLEDNINTSLENTLKNKTATPRYPVYVKELDVLEVCVSGADCLYYNAETNKISFRFQTCKIPDVSKINKKLLIKILDSLQAPSKEISVEQEMIIKYRVIAKKQKLTESQRQEISKYEQRRKGHW